MTEAHHMPRVTPEVRKTILQLWRDGVGPSSIAVRLGMQRRAVIAVIRPKGHREEDDVQMYPKKRRVQ